MNTTDLIISQIESGRKAALEYLKPITFEIFNPEADNADDFTEDPDTPTFLYDNGCEIARYTVYVIRTGRVVGVLPYSLDTYEASLESLSTNELVDLLYYLR